MENQKIKNLSSPEFKISNFLELFFLLSPFSIHYCPLLTHFSEDAGRVRGMKSSGKHGVNDVDLRDRNSSQNGHQAGYRARSAIQSWPPKREEAQLVSRLILELN